MSASLVIWRGPSRLDRSPIVALLQLRTSNSKTGDIPSIWIEPDNVDIANPRSTCGDCPLRAGGCYVDARGVFSIRAATQGKALAPWADVRRIVAGRVLRLGSHGDPLALPLPLIRRLVGLASATVGYTHHWRRHKSPATGGWLQSAIMASVENSADAKEAQRLGWRTYRIRPWDTPLEPGEIQCPAVVRPGAVTCQQCKVCGTAGRRSVSVEVHGGAVAVKVAAAIVL